MASLTNVVDGVPGCYSCARRFDRNYHGHMTVILQVPEIVFTANGVHRIISSAFYWCDKDRCQNAIPVRYSLECEIHKRVSNVHVWMVIDTQLSAFACVTYERAVQVLIKNNGMFSVEAILELTHDNIRATSVAAAASSSSSSGRPDLVRGIDHCIPFEDIEPYSGHSTKSDVSANTEDDGDMSPLKETGDVLDDELKYIGRHMFDSKDECLMGPAMCHECKQYGSADNETLRACEDCGPEKRDRVFHSSWCLECHHSANHRDSHRECMVCDQSMRMPALGPHSNCHMCSHTTLFCSNACYREHVDSVHLQSECCGVCSARQPRGHAFLLPCSQCPRIKMCSARCLSRHQQNSHPLCQICGRPTKNTNDAKICTYCPSNQRTTICSAECLDRHMMNHGDLLHAALERNRQSPRSLQFAQHVLNTVGLASGQSSRLSAMVNAGLITTTTTVDKCSQCKEKPKNVEFKCLGCEKETYCSQACFEVHLTARHKSIAVKSPDERCVVCFESKRDTVTLPCKHLATCFGCASKCVQTKGECLICRALVESLLYIFHS
jgi:hypothetical protein